MKLQIWHNIVWSSYKAGVFNALAEQAPQRGVELMVTQIAATSQDREALSKVDTSRHRYPFELLFDTAYSRIPFGRLVRTLACRTWRGKADVTMLVEISRPEYWVQAIILRLRGRKLAVFCDSTLYDHHQTFLKGLAKRAMFALCGNVFAYGQRARAYALYYGVKADNIFHRNQAAALPDDYDAASIPARRVAAGGGAPLFLYVGRLSPEKRIETLIEAFARVLPQMPGARLRIVGGGPQAEALKALVASLDLGDAVEFTGGQSLAQIFAHYLEATAFVLPSWSEPWGLVVNEALHFGCPVIVSHRCGCVPELVEDSEAGEVFPCEDAEDLARRLLDAPERYADRDSVARAALARIAPYTPQAAGQAILDGVAVIAAR